MFETVGHPSLYLTSILDAVKVFEHLHMLWMGTWVHPYTLTPLLVGKLRKITGIQVSQKTSWCHGWGYETPHSVSHIHIECIESVWAPCYAVDGHMRASLHCYMCADGDKFQKFGGLGYGWAQITSCLMFGGCGPTHSVSHIHIECIESVWASSYAVDGHMGPPLHFYSGGNIMEI